MFLALAGAWVVLSPSLLQASFLEESDPPRTAALGGNDVACPEGSGCLTSNPACLSDNDTYLASARYQSLLDGVEGDDLGTGSLVFLAPAGRYDGWGASWDHFNANHLQQDRLRLAAGHSCQIPESIGTLDLGFSLSLLSQRYTLSEPLASVSDSHLSASALSFGVGFLWKPLHDLSLAAAGEDLTRPNLGVVGVDRFESSLRCGAAYDFHLSKAGRLTLTGGVRRVAAGPETDAGLEWFHPRLGLALRAGAGSRHASAGFGFTRGGLTIDYAYVFSAWGAASLDDTGLPGSHLFELLWRWGGRLTPEDPDSFPALMRKAGDEESHSKWNEALWTYRRAIQKMPDDSAAQAGWNRVRAAFNRDRALYYLDFGRQAEERGFTIEAQHNYEWALQLDPDSQAAQDGLARMKAAAPQGAMADSRVIRDLQEAAALAAKGERGKAVELLKNSLVRYPQDPALRDFTQALASASPTPVKGPDPAVDRLMAEAEIYRLKGRSDLAKDAWKQVLIVDPKNAQALDKLQEAKSGTATAKAAAPADKARAQALYERGLKAYLNGEVRAAIKDWESALSYDPDQENALNNLARARLELNRFGSESPPRPTATATTGTPGEAP